MWQPYQRPQSNQQDCFKKILKKGVNLNSMLLMCVPLTKIQWVMNAFCISKRCMWEWKYISSQFSVMAHTVDYLTQFNTIICSVTTSIFLLVFKVLIALWLSASVCANFSHGANLAVVNIIPVMNGVIWMASCLFSLYFSLFNSLMNIHRTPGLFHYPTI